jgi:hypothetical protein
VRARRLLANLEARNKVHSSAKHNGKTGSAPQIYRRQVFFCSTVDVVNKLAKFFGLVLPIVRVSERASLSTTIIIGGGIEFKSAP